jgi:starch phosphorylase
MSIYNTLKANSEFRESYLPHTFIFGAKAAGTYYFAKKVIKLINTIADKVNNDPITNKYLKVVFVENYNVSYAEVIMPAADISEQISTASKEASGTGNMKFMMNGAITLGTLDGANVEIDELVGRDNIFIFGLNSEEVNSHYQNNDYNSKAVYESDSEIRILLDQLINGFFDSVDRYEFKEIFDNLVFRDQYFVLKDYQAYKAAHNACNEAYKDKSRWAKMALINIAKSGVFSSDRSIQDYAEKIWKVKPVIKG